MMVSLMTLTYAYSQHYYKFCFLLGFIHVNEIIFIMNVSSKETNDTSTSKLNLQTVSLTVLCQAMDLSGRGWFTFGTTEMVGKPHISKTVQHNRSIAVKSNGMPKVYLHFRKTNVRFP